MISRERIGLVHELRKLRTAEEFANRGHDRLGVHEVVRHGGGHFLVHRHLFLDGALHADEADAELVLEEFADRAHAAVAEVIDVVERADVLAQLHQVADGRDEVGGVERARVERRFEAELDVEFQAAHAAEIVLARVEEHSVEQGRGRFERRRIAGAQLPVDFDQRFAGRLDGVLVQRAGKHHADVVAVGEKDIDAGDARFGERSPDFGGQRLVGFEQNFSGLPVHEIGDGVGALEIRDGNVRGGNLGLDEFLVERFGDALVRADQHFVVLGTLDFVGQLAVDQAFGKVPVQVAVAQRDALDLVERAQNFFVRLHAQGAQENRAEEFALAVDADVQNILGVVLELDPRAAVRNDFPEEIAAVVGRFVKHAGRAVQLADDHALGAVDDEGAVVGHQRNVAEENFLFLDVANIFRAGVGILVVNGQTDGDLERGGVGHAALLALVHVVLQLHADRVAALFAERGRVLVERAALGAEHVARLIRIGDDRGAAIAAGGAQVMQPLQVAALAFPVPDRVVHEIQLREAAEILNRKHRGKDRLQAAVLALGRKQIHLQKSLIGILLNLDQVRNLNRAPDLGKIQALALSHMMIPVSIRHAMTSRTAQGWAETPMGGMADTAAPGPGGTESRLTNHVLELA